MHIKLTADHLLLVRESRDCVWSQPRAGGCFLPVWWGEIPCDPAAWEDGSLWAPGGCGGASRCRRLEPSEPSVQAGGRRAPLRGAGLRGLPTAEPPPPARNTWKGLDVALNVRQLCKPHGCKAAQRQTWKCGRVPAKRAGPSPPYLLLPSHT